MSNTPFNDGPWLNVDRGSVDEVKFPKICHKH